VGLGRMRFDAEPSVEMDPSTSTSHLMSSMPAVPFPELDTMALAAATEALGESEVTRALGFKHTTSSIHVKQYPDMIREHLPSLMQKLGFNGAGAEVGVWEGVNSEHIVANWPSCSKFYCVDLYLSEEMGCEPGDPKWQPQEVMDEIAQRASDKMARFGDKVEFVRENSLLAAMSMPADSLDFVYMDTSVGRENVFYDLLAWYPVVRPGGVLAGHDYLNAAGSTAGALEFLTLKVGGNITLHVTGEQVPSFFFFKPVCPPVQFQLSEVHGKMSESEKRLVQLLDAERSFDNRVHKCGEEPEQDAPTDYED